MITIGVYPVDPTDDTKLDDLTYVSDSLRFSTQLHGGFGSCTIRIGAQFWRSFRYLEDRMLCRLRVRDSGENLFDGRIIKVTSEPGQLSIEGEGYWGHGKDVFADLIYPDDTPEDAASIAADMVGLATYWNSTTDYINPDSVSLPTVNSDEGGLDYMDSFHITDILEDVCKYGTSDGVPLYAAIWDDRILHLKPRKSASDGPDWTVHAYDLAGGQQGVSTARDASHFGNSIACIYSSTVGERAITAEATDADSITKYGTIQKRLSISGASSAEAIVFRDLAIAESAEPRQSVAVLLDSVVWKSGSPVPIRFVRAGDNVRLSLDPRASGGTNTYDNLRLLHVIQTDYDANSNRMRLTLETGFSTLDQILAWSGLSGGRLF